MRVHHLAFRTHDISRLVTFYVDLLGLRVRANHKTDDGGLRSVWLDADGVVIMIERADENEPMPSPHGLDLVALATTPSEQTQCRARLEQAGVAIEAATAFTIYFRDPDQRRVGLSTYQFS